jgi:hypothetical protein
MRNRLQKQIINNLKIPKESKMKKRIALLLALALAMFAFTACAVHTGELKLNRTLTGVTVTSPPDKTAYREGEYFDPAGMIVAADFSDGTRYEDTAYTYDKTGPLTLTDTRVTISYTEHDVTRTAAVPITVSPNSTAGGRSAVSITLTSPPDKTVYNEGDYFDFEGMLVTAA